MYSEVCTINTIFSKKMQQYLLLVNMHVENDCKKMYIILTKGAIQVLRNADGGGGGVCQIFRKKRYEGVMFNVISVTSRWVGVQFAEK